MLILKKSSILLAVAFVLVGCSQASPETGQGEKEKVVPTVNEAEEKTVDQEEPTNIVMPYAYPLSGVGTEERSDTRAVAVMINNHMAARPQSGLAKADIVYEVLAEGSVTRFLAIYQSEQPERIGPVRSARDYFIHLSDGYDALYIAHGYSPDAHQMLMSGKYDHLNGMQFDGTLFKRSSDRRAPHNSYIAYDQIEKGAEGAGYEMDTAPEGLDFFQQEEWENLTGSKAEGLMIAYDGGSHFSSEYTYNSSLGKYERYSDGEKTVDFPTEEAVLIDNLFIMETSHRVIDAEGRIAIDLTSGGKAMLLQKGVVKELEWKNVNGRLLPFADGLPAKLIPGKTWISIVPSLSIVSEFE